MRVIPDLSPCPLEAVLYRVANYSYRPCITLFFTFCSSHAVFLSNLVFTSLANKRADQSERRVPPAPIMMSEWSSRPGGPRRILFTQPRGTTEHESPLVTAFKGSSRHLDLGISLRVQIGTFIGERGREGANTPAFFSVLHRI